MGIAGRLFTPFVGLVDTLTYMRSPRLIIFLAVIVCLGSSQQTGQAELLANEESLHAVHDALFSSFLPINDLEHDSRTTMLLVGARDEMWSEANRSPELERFAVSSLTLAQQDRSLSPL
jgi:hypothetical protein